jgi:voltage-gated potassium channel
MTEEQAVAAARLEIPVLIAVLLTIPTLVLASIDGNETLDLIVDVLNWAIWLTFLAEAVIMIRIAPDNRAWARANTLDIAVLVLTPPFLPEAFHALWVLRLLRILDLMPVMGRLFRFNGFRYAAMLAFLGVFGGGIAFHELEEERYAADDSPIDLFDGIWWAMTTISTVGYGDFFPTSAPGRIVGMTLMLLGPVLIGLVASGIGTAITEEIRRDLSEVQAAGAEVVEDVQEIKADVAEVEEDVEQLSLIDRRVLARLDEIADRLTKLEQRGGP